MTIILLYMQQHAIGWGRDICNAPFNCSNLNTKYNEVYDFHNKSTVTGKE